MLTLPRIDEIKNLLKPIGTNGYHRPVTVEIGIFDECDLGLLMHLDMKVYSYVHLLKNCQIKLTLPKEAMLFIGSCSGMVKDDSFTDDFHDSVEYLRKWIRWFEDEDTDDVYEEITVIEFLEEFLHVSEVLLSIGDAIHGDIIVDKCIITPSLDVDTEKDKNGNDIFDGDIIEYDGTDYVACAEYFAAGQYLEVVELRDLLFEPGKLPPSRKPFSDWELCTVIGHLDDYGRHNYEIVNLR